MHTPDLTAACEEPAPTPLHPYAPNPAGMEDYFSSHVCGATCEALGLDKSHPVRDILPELRRRILEQVTTKDDGTKEAVPTGPGEAATSSGAAADGCDARSERSDASYVGAVDKLAADRGLNTMGIDPHSDSDGEGEDSDVGGSPPPPGPSTSSTAARPAVTTTYYAPSYTTSSYSSPSRRRSGWRPVCRYWKAGNCWYGDNCRFHHPKKKRGGRRRY